MRLRPRKGLLAGIAVLASGSVVLEIALARATSALFGRHVALAAPTLALAGAGLGGALLAAMPGLVRRTALLARLAMLAGLAGAATLAALLVLVHVKVPDTLDRAALGPAAAVYLTALLPFFFVGLGVAAAVRHVPVLAGRVVFALFSGAALGAPLALGAMRAGALRAALLVTMAYAFASLLFYLGARGADRVVKRPRGSTVATFLLASVVLLAGDLGAPWLKLPSLRFTPIDKIEVQEWSGLGLLTVDKAQTGVSWIHTDGSDALPIYDSKTAVPLAPDEMAYVLHREQGPVAILGGGGGREVRVALKYGQKEIDVVERDPILVRAIMRDRYKKTSGDAYDNPSVKVTLEDFHGFVRRADRAYRNIVLALPDGQAAQAAGTLAADPDDLYTLESFTDLLARLQPEGTITAIRWDAEADRLLALTMEALRRSGVADPGPHVYACSASRATTVLIRKTPIPAVDLPQLHGFCRRNKMTEVFASDQPPRRRVDGLTDLRPPTADRPFFGATVPAALLVKTLTEKAAPASAQALLVLTALLGVAAVLVFFSVALPFVAWPRWSVGRAGPLLFFTGVGAGLGFAAVALLPRLLSLLGHPIYTFTTVLPALLASMGAGGLLMARVRPRAAEARAGVRAELLATLLAVGAVALDPLIEVALGLPFGARVVAAMALLVPVGLLGGALLALGVRLVASVSPPLVAWCWGMAGVGAFVAGAVGVPGVMILGYSTGLLAAGVSVWVAAVCVPRGSG